MGIAFAEKVAATGEKTEKTGHADSRKEIRLRDALTRRGGGELARGGANVGTAA